MVQVIQFQAFTVSNCMRYTVCLDLMLNLFIRQSVLTGSDVLSQGCVWSVPDLTWNLCVDPLQFVILRSGKAEMLCQL